MLKFATKTIVSGCIWNHLNILHFMNQKIFVTGGTGFVGSYLLRYLVQRGHQNILALKRSSSSMALVEAVKDKITWVEGDILDISFLEEIMEGVQQIYHCAALVSFDPREATKMMQINIEGTANIVNIALFHKVKKVVHISSIAALGNSKPGETQDEKTSWKDDKNTSNYAKSKYYAEMEVWRGIAEGLNAAILNPSLVLGAGFWDRGTGTIFKLYASGFPFYSEGIGGLVDVRDVARMAIQVMESEIQEERFIVSAENMVYKKLFTQIAILANVTKPFIKINRFMKEIGWRLDWLKTFFTGTTPTITKESLRSADNQTYYTNQKSLDILDFEYTPIEETLKETVKQIKLAKSLEPMVLPLNKVDR